MTPDPDGREHDDGASDEGDGGGPTRTASRDDGDSDADSTAEHAETEGAAEHSTAGAGASVDSGAVDRALRDEVLGRDPDRTGRVSTDRLFELLSSPGNRFVLTYVLGSDDPVEFAELVEYVVERTETPTGMTDAKFRGRVAATLINERLPELESAGLVAVDSTEQRVSTTHATALAAPHLALSLSELVAPRH